LDLGKIYQKIADKMSVYPPGCVTKRDVVQVFEFKDPSMEEIEKTLSDLDRVVTKALLDFHEKNLKRLEKIKT
jgi:hypothetical protein